MPINTIISYIFISSIYHVNRPVKHCQEKHCYRLTASGQKPTKTAGLTNGLVSGTLCIITHGCVDGAMWVVHRNREPAAGVSRCECSPQSPARAGFRKTGSKPAAYGNPADPVTMVRRLTRAPLSGRRLRQTGWYREFFFVPEALPPGLVFSSPVVQEVRRSTFPAKSLRIMHYEL